MRINHLLQIVEHLYKKIACPYCKHSFQGKNPNIKFFNESEIICTAECEHCKSKVTMKANIKRNHIHKRRQENKRKDQTEQKQTTERKKELSPESVKNIAKKIQDFSSKNISDLFL